MIRRPLLVAAMTPLAALASIITDGLGWVGLHGGTAHV